MCYLPVNYVTVYGQQNSEVDINRLVVFDGMEMIRNNRIVDLQHVLNYF
jgi:hypothetical protein